MSDPRERFDALDLWEQVACAATTIAFAAGQMRVSEITGRAVDPADLYAARRALSDGLRALDEYERRE